MTIRTKNKPPIEQVNRSAAQSFPWGSIQWLISDELFEGCELTLGHVEIGSGEKNVLHVHPNCDEALFLIEGELLHSVGDEKFNLMAGQAIFIPRNVKHDAVNLSSVTARMIVAYSSGDRQTVMLEEGQEA